MYLDTSKKKRTGKLAKMYSEEELLHLKVMLREG